MTDPSSTSSPIDGGLGGLWVPIVTPFTDDGSVDAVSLERLAHRLLADGVDGLVALATTGEAATLDPSERRVVVAVCDRVCRHAGRPLMVGAGAVGTAQTVSEIMTLTDGIDAVAALVVVPYYLRPGEQAVIEHYASVAAQSPVPIVMYNVPYRTGQGMSALSLLEAGRFPNVIGLKQAVGALDEATLELAAKSEPDFSLLAGDDAFIVPTILIGGSGAVSAAANVRTGDFVQMVAAARSGDVATATEVAATLLPVVQAGFREPNPSVFKSALAAQGDIASAYVRAPLAMATAAARQQLVGLL